MLRQFCAVYLILLFVLNYIHLSTSITTLNFEFTDEARAALCPFVGTEGMRCFDNESNINRHSKNLDINSQKLPRGIGISIDRNTGQLKALAVELTHSTDDSRTWTDGFTSEIFNIFNEAAVGSPTRVVNAYNALRFQIFHNASQLDGVWQQTYVDGKIRGGRLARPPEFYEYLDKCSSTDNALLLLQRITALYTLRINASTIRLNTFARRALSQLTTAFDLDLYDSFINAWGTHIITMSLIGGMIEEQASVARCVLGDENSTLVRCILSDQNPINPICAYYRDRNRLISKRRLGGNMRATNDNEWGKSLALAPALLQVLDMVPWYELVTDAAVKQNLRTMILYRQENMDSARAREARLVDARLSLCNIAPLCSAHISRNAEWKKIGVTVAGGNGPGSLANQLNDPHGFTLDNDDTLYIVEWENHRAVEWKLGTSRASIIAGGKGPGFASDCLKYPADIIVDKTRGSLFIVDHGNNRIVRWSLHSGRSGDIIYTDTSSVISLTMDQHGFLYTADAQRNEVKRWRVGEAHATIVAGGNGAGGRLDQINNPRKIFVDYDQTVYVSELGNHRVTKWVKGSKQGIVVAGGRGQGSSLSQLNFPEGVVVDQFETVYVADRSNHRIMRWVKGATEGQVIAGGNGAGSETHHLRFPISLAFDRFGNLLVGDSKNHRIQKFEII